MWDVRCGTWDNDGTARTWDGYDAGLRLGTTTARDQKSEVSGSNDNFKGDYQTVRLAAEAKRLGTTTARYQISARG